LGHIKENKRSGGPAKGLEKCLDYIFNKDKTVGLRYIGSYNYQMDKNNPIESSFKAMTDTKSVFDKPGGRQGYHYKLSFPNEDVVTPELAMKITGEFCEKVFTDYECAYAIHTNTGHIHAHIVFNSIDIKDGYKYQYKKGDWSKYIMPAANEICRKYGISELDLDLDEEMKLSGKCKDYGRWAVENKKVKDGRLIYTNAMIKADVDECISWATDYDNFILLLRQRNLRVDDSKKYITILAPGRVKTCRIYNLTPDRATYTRENIIRMIAGTYISREELFERLFVDWNRYEKEKTELTVGRVSKELARYMEAKVFVEKNGIHSKEDVELYKDYLNRADRELNIIRKYVRKSVGERAEAINKMLEMLECFEGYNHYVKDRDESCVNVYKKMMENYRYISNQGYGLSELYTYKKSADRLLESIEDFKKHIFVEKKICERVEDEKLGMNIEEKRY
jgi:hypothetical protein